MHNLPAVSCCFTIPSVMDSARWMRFSTFLSDGSAAATLSSWEYILITAPSFMCAPTKPSTSLTPHLRLLFSKCFCDLSSTFRGYLFAIMSHSSCVRWRLRLTSFSWESRRFISAKSHFWRTKPLEVGNALLLQCLTDDLSLLDELWYISL